MGGALADNALNRSAADFKSITVEIVTGRGTRALQRAVRVRNMGCVTRADKQPQWGDVSEGRIALLLLLEVRVKPIRKTRYALA